MTRTRIVDEEMKYFLTFDLLPTSKQSRKERTVALKALVSKAYGSNCRLADQQ